MIDKTISYRYIFGQFLSNITVIDILDTLRPSSPKPGHPERIGSMVSPSASRSHPRGIERFLKINVKHITDGQVRI